MGTNTYTEAIRYGESAVVYLRGNSSQTVVLNDTAPTVVKFEPNDRRAIEVEVRVIWQQLIGMPDNIDPNVGSPVIRWATRLGHGRSIFDEPAPSFALTNNVVVPGLTKPRPQLYALPARGAVARVTARELSIVLVNTGWEGGGLTARQTFGEFYTVDYLPGTPTFPKVAITVSFQPVTDLQVPVYPRSTYHRASQPAETYEFGNYVPFPPAANEWRVFDDRGEPFDPAIYTVGAGYTGADIGDIVCMDALGRHTSYVRAANIGDFQPIPFNAYAFASFNGNFSNGGVRPRNMFVEFR